VASRLDAQRRPKEGARRFDRWVSYAKKVYWSLGAMGLDYTPQVDCGPRARGLAVTTAGWGTLPGILRVRGGLSIAFAPVRPGVGVDGPPLSARHARSERRHPGGQQ
jgi:hypothetical protein